MKNSSDHNTSPTHSIDLIVSIIRFVPCYQTHHLYSHSFLLTYHLPRSLAPPPSLNQVLDDYISLRMSSILPAPLSRPVSSTLRRSSSSSSTTTTTTTSSRCSPEIIKLSHLKRPILLAVVSLVLLLISFYYQPSKPIAPWSRNLVTNSHFALGQHAWHHFYLPQLIEEPSAGSIEQPPIYSFLLDHVRVIDASLNERSAYTVAHS